MSLMVYYKINESFIASVVQYEAFVKADLFFVLFLKIPYEICINSERGEFLITAYSYVCS